MKCKALLLVLNTILNTMEKPQYEQIAEINLLRLQGKIPEHERLDEILSTVTWEDGKKYKLTPIE